MRQQDELRLLVKVATLYYEESRTQQEISDSLGLSRPKVSRLLQQARDMGIVQISILPPSGVHADLEKALEQRYGLKEVVVAEVQEYTSAASSAREIGTAAAEFLMRVVKPGDVIGLSWGRTLAAMVSAMRPEPKGGLTVVQVTGGLGPPSADTHASGLATRLANALEATLHLLPAPGVVDSPSTRSALLSDSHIRRALTAAQKASAIFVGIGTPSRGSIVMQMGDLMTWEELERLVQLGAVGDVALHYFDVKGRPILPGLSERAITMAADALKSVPRVVGVAGGAGKLEAILGAVRGRWINCLVTDHVTAAKLLEAGGSPS